jgi:ATP-dependent helicase HrpB
MSERLPIFEIEPELVRLHRATPERRRFVVEAPTGSGKSTQIPQMLLANGLLNGGEVIILQPRRIAARMLARRVAEEMGVRLGDEVGYQVRFESAVGPKTVIRFVTEGILLRRMLDDPTLQGVSAVVFDEFHERHLYGDISLARALTLQERHRPDLTLLVMSATLQTAELKRYLEPCHHLVSAGRTFPVETVYAPPRLGVVADLSEHAARVAGLAAQRHPEGHMLIFMPGGYEIRKTMEALEREKNLRQFEILPLHGELSPKAQDAAVSGFNERRRIVVATNVAETSLTIDGIRVVIDAGNARIAAYDANRGINTLTIQNISRASADQRQGRAGRTGPGVCYRLWSEEHHAKRAAAEVPEVKRLDLAEVVLSLHAAGERDLSVFRWFDAPEEKSLLLAKDLLIALGAILQDGTITPVGKKLTRYPVHPRQARILEGAADFGCLPEIAVCVALMQGRSLFAKPHAQTTFTMRDDWSDFQPLLRAFRSGAEANFPMEAMGRVGINSRAAVEAGRLAERLMSIAGDRETSLQQLQEIHREPFAKALLTGYSDQVARRTNIASIACDVVGGRRGGVAKDSVVRGNEFLVAAEITEVQGRDVQVILNWNTELEESWLRDLFPNDFVQSNKAVWDASQKRVFQKEMTQFRSLLLREKQSGEPDENQAAAMLAEQVLAGNIQMTSWDDGVQQWLSRVKFLRKVMPELELPEFTDEDHRLVLEELFHGCKTAKEIKEINPWNALRSWLSWEQNQQLEKHAPDRLELHSGLKVKVDYTAPYEPTISAVIQRLFGQRDTPKIASGRVPVLVHLLAPSQRPVQVTKDLAGFWKNSYPEIAKELKRRYPKHDWSPQ